MYLKLQGCTLHILFLRVFVCKHVAETDTVKTAQQNGLAIVIIQFIHIVRKK